MKSKVPFPLLVSAILTVNIVGFVLKLLDFDTFFIFMGFRFHLSLVLPFFFIAYKLNISEIKREFTDPVYKKNYSYVISLILVPMLLFTVLYIIGYMELGDPEYFYEFGMSSVLDLPIYILWNAPQLILFYFFLFCVSAGRKVIVLVVFVVSILLFVYEFVTIDPLKIDTAGMVSLVLVGVINGLLIDRLRNLYWFTVFLFILNWQFILLFGSGSPILIKIMFASQFSSWEGFFVLQNGIKEYSLPAYNLVIASLVFILSLSVKKEKYIL